MSALEGIRVLELGQLIAGPTCGKILADFGAEVVKIEPPQSGDPMRQWGRRDADGNSLWWPEIARNKKSLTLDLRTEKAQEIARALACEADILIENFRPGRMESWGLGWDVLHALNPRLIMVRITGFGQTGPYASRGGFASVGEAMGGLRAIVGYPDREPVRLGISIGDTLAGQSGALGALMALQARHNTGVGQMIDAAIYEAVLGVTESIVPEYDKAAHVRKPTGAVLPGIAPSNIYPTKDGHSIVIGANQDAVFRRLVNEIGRPDLATDERFFDHRSRGQNQNEIDEIVGEWTATQELDVLVDRLSKIFVPAGPIYTAREMLDDPHFKARNAITRVKANKIGPLAMPNVFPRLSETPGGIRHAGPELGEDNEDVLMRWLGYSQDAIDSLAATSVISVSGKPSG